MFKKIFSNTFFLPNNQIIKNNNCIDLNAYRRQKFINTLKRNKYIILFIALSYILTLFLGWEYRKNNSYADIVNRNIITDSQFYIKLACDNFDKAIDDSEEIKPLYLFRAGEKLKLASNYYYKDKYHKNNLIPTDFFNSYSDILKEWVSAINHNDQVNMPSKNDIENMKTDLDNISTRFSAFGNIFSDNHTPIDRISVKEYNEFILQLIDEIKTDSVKKELINKAQDIS